MATQTKKSEDLYLLRKEWQPMHRLVFLNLPTSKKKSIEEQFGELWTKQHIIGATFLNSNAGRPRTQPELRTDAHFLSRKFFQRCVLRMVVHPQPANRGVQVSQHQRKVLYLVYGAWICGALLVNPNEMYAY